MGEGCQWSTRHLILPRQQPIDQKFQQNRSSTVRAIRDAPCYDGDPSHKYKQTPFTRLKVNDDKNPLPGSNTNMSTHWDNPIYKHQGCYFIGRIK